MSDREAFESIYRAAPEHRTLLLIWQQQLEAWGRALAYERSRFEQIECYQCRGEGLIGGVDPDTCSYCLGTGKLWRKKL